MRYWFIVLFFVFCRTICMNSGNDLQAGLTLLNTAKKVGYKKIVDAQILCLCALDTFIKTQSFDCQDKTINLYNKLQKKVHKKTYSEKQLQNKKHLITLIEKDIYTAISNAESPLFTILSFCNQAKKDHAFPPLPPSEVCQLSMRLCEAKN